MIVTVCEIENGTDFLEQEWRKLVRPVRTEGSDLVLLPEMPFYALIAETRTADRSVWQASVEMHERWQPRLAEL